MGLTLSNSVALTGRRGGRSTRVDPIAALFRDPSTKGALLSSAAPIANYQTDAGIVQAGFGDPVGLALDTKNGVPAPDGPGTHFPQPVLADRPTRGRQPLVGVRNLADHSEDFTRSNWGKVAATITANATIAPDGTATADKLVENSAAAAPHYVRLNSVALVNGAEYSASIYVKAAERTRVHLTLFNGSTDDITIYNLADGSIVSGSGQIESVGNGWFLISNTLTAAATTTTNFAFQVQLNNGTTNVYDGDGSSGAFVWGGQWEIGSIATPYQRRVTINDITEAGVPDVAHLRGNGVNQNARGNDTARAILRDAPGAEAHWAIIWEGGANAWLWFYSRNGAIAPRFALRVNADGSLTAQVRRADGDATTTVSTAAGAITANVRTIVGLSVDYAGGGASAITIWINGVAVATGELTGTGNISDTLSDRVRIFSNAADTEFFKGFLLRELPLTARLWTTAERNTVIPRLAALTGITL